MENAIEVKFVKLRQGAHIPSKAHDGDIGLDVRVDDRHDEILLAPHKRAIFKTGLATILPEGWGLEVRDRSSMGSKNIGYLAGEIDQQYRGEIGIILGNNNSDMSFLFVHSDVPEGATTYTMKSGIYRGMSISLDGVKVMSFKNAIAQLKLHKIPTVNVTEATMDDLNASITESQRGTNGYGSTNVK